MCGISGIFHFNNQVKGANAIEQMTEALSHRGPDASGIFEDLPIQLGHRRLSIIDLDESSNQPFASQDNRYILVFNGEIYNYKQLKSQLTEYNFITESDTEVVLAAYITWGSSAVEKLEGMFAFAVWDKLKQNLFIARDRLGIKPLYYFQSDEVFLFASEVRSLLKSDLVPKKIDHSALSDYFRYQTVHAPNTIIRNVKQLPSGTFLTLEEDDFVINSYWLAEERRELTDLSNEVKTKKIVKKTFFDAVEKRLIADVPFGAFLSGGIDSSAVVAAMSEVSSKTVNTFSVVFDDQQFSEEKYAELVARKFETNHKMVRLQAEDLLHEIPSALKAMDHPSGDGINTYVVSKATKEAGITVALSGLGGDELFSGYPVFRQMEQLNDKKWLQSWPKEFRKLAASVNSMIRPSVQSQKLKEVLSLDHFELENLYPISRQLYFEKELSRILNVPIEANRVLEIAKNMLAFKTAGSKLQSQSKVSVLEFNTYMQNVLLRDADQMSMAHALEIRVPFLDHKLVELVLSIPSSQKLSGFPKQLLVESMGDLIPEAVYNRSKMGFVLPWEKWLKNEMKELVVEKLDFLVSTNLFNKSKISELWNKFLGNSPEMNWVKIWSFVVLANWIQENEIEID